MKIAIFPGSFDPITLGHVDIINRASFLFDKLIVGIGNNSAKAAYFELDKRKSWIEATFKDNSNIEVAVYEGLTTKFAEANNAQFLVRGLRSGLDFEYEEPIAVLNKSLGKGVETIFLVSAAEHRAISSSIVREIHRNGGNISALVPSGVTI